MQRARDLKVEHEASQTSEAHCSNSNNNYTPAISKEITIDTYEISPSREIDIQPPDILTNSSSIASTSYCFPEPFEDNIQSTLESTIRFQGYLQQNSVTPILTDESYYSRNCEPDIRYKTDISSTCTNYFIPEQSLDEGSTLMPVNQMNDDSTLRATTQISSYSSAQYFATQDDLEAYNYASCSSFGDPLQKHCYDPIPAQAFTTSIPESTNEIHQVKFASEQFEAFGDNHRFICEEPLVTEDPPQFPNNEILDFGPIEPLFQESECNFN